MAYDQIKVQVGDSFDKIARAFYGDAGELPIIVGANTIPESDKRTVGQDLVIPGAGVAPIAVTLSWDVASSSPDKMNPTGTFNEQRLGLLQRIPAIRSAPAA